MVRNIFFVLTVFCFLSDAPVRGDGPDFKLDDMMNQNCPNYRCSAGMTPAPKSRQKFESTGCSTMGAGSMMAAGGDGGAKAYESCCDQWHACYQICGVSKKACDTAFEECGKEKCGDDDEACNKELNMSKLMMQLGGCQGYNQAQYQACECVTKDQAGSKREAALRYFYKKQAPENVDKVEGLVKKADSSSKFAGLMKKLLVKYPKAILKKADPMQEMFDKIKIEQEKKGGEDTTEEEVSDEDESEERIEL